ncbi:hypothetical protein GCM10027615_65960 [Plantactinospora veratri]
MPLAAEATERRPAGRMAAVGATPETPGAATAGRAGKLDAPSSPDAPPSPDTPAYAGPAYPSVPASASARASVALRRHPRRDLTGPGPARSTVPTASTRASPSAARPVRVGVDAARPAADDALRTLPVRIMLPPCFEVRVRARLAVRTGRQLEVD